MEATPPSELLGWYDSGHGISTDTRTIQPGNLYFALKGERFDGNQYAERALESGAFRAVVDDPKLAGKPGMAWVEDGLKALQDLARAHRRRFQGRVIGMTGSNGKTTTKELLLKVLNQRFHAVATKGNLNNEIGVPLTLLSMPMDADFAIVEMGANAVGEIAALCQIAEPDWGLITNIGLAHLEGFGGPEGVKRGKRELFQFLSDRPDSRVFVNAGKANLMEVSESQNRTLFGTPNHPPHAELLPTLPDGLEGSSAFLLHGLHDVPTGPYAMQMDGAHNVENALVALVVGNACGVPWADGLKAVADYQPTNNRSQWTQTERNRILLDAYNANPSSMELALKTFAAGGHPRPLAVLGDMGELGEHATSAHRDIAQVAASLDVEVWLVGDHFGAVAEELGLRGFRTAQGMLEALEQEGYEGRTVLLKGSRSLELERAVAYL